VRHFILTKDKQLICRHERCDLHLTTNVLMTPLASKCTQQYHPAIGNLPAPCKAAALYDSIVCSGYCIQAPRWPMEKSDLTKEVLVLAHSSVDPKEES